MYSIVLGDYFWSCYITAGTWFLHHFCLLYQQKCSLGFPQILVVSRLVIFAHFFPLLYRSQALEGSACLFRSIQIFGGKKFLCWSSPEVLWSAEAVAVFPALPHTDKKGCSRFMRERFPGFLQDKIGQNNLFYSGEKMINQSINPLVKTLLFTVLV